LFFFEFAPTKVAKTTKQIKTNFLTNIRKQIGTISEEKKATTLKEKKKKGESKFPLYQSLAMAPTCAQKQPKKKKKGAQAPPLLKPSDGAIGTHKQQNRKIKNKKRDRKLPLC